MNISVKVTGNILEYLESKVNCGLYKSRSEVIREAIHKMIQKDLQEQMKAKGITIESLENLREEVSGELLDEKKENSLLKQPFFFNLLVFHIFLIFKKQ